MVAAKAKDNWRSALLTSYPAAAPAYQEDEYSRDCRIPSCLVAAAAAVHSAATMASATAAADDYRKEVEPNSGASWHYYYHADLMTEGDDDHSGRYPY